MSRAKSAIAALKEYYRPGLEPGKLRQFLDSLASESDRGLVILMGTYLEDLLEYLLCRRMRPMNSEVRKSLFGPDRPLGSFSNKIALAYALEVIGEFPRDELNIIREMRNACAHSRREISFATPELREVFYGMLDPESRALAEQGPSVQFLRSAFLTCCSVIISEMVSPVSLGKDPNSLRPEILRGE